MSAVPLLQKLIVLKLMNLCKHPLTSDQITVYLVENGWSDYLLSQQLKLELAESHLIQTADTLPFFCTLTPEGYEAITMFEAQIPAFLSDQVEAFVRENRERIFRESAVFVHVIANDDAFRVNVQIYTGLTLVVDLNIHRWSRESALQAADEMRANAYDYFSFLLQK